MRSNAPSSASAISGRFSSRDNSNATDSMVDSPSLRGSRRSVPESDRLFGPRITRWHFNIHGLRHHNALAWLHVPSSTTPPSRLLRIAFWPGSSPPLRSIATTSRSISRSETLAEPRYRIAQSAGSTSRPSAFDRLGHDRPIFSVAFESCKAVSRAVPSNLSCSCGCCRIRTSIRFSIGSRPSQTQSGSGLPQSGHSEMSSAGAVGDVSDMPRYTRRYPMRQQLRRLRPGWLLVTQPAAKQLAPALAREQFDVADELGPALAPLQNDLAAVECFELRPVSHAEDGRGLQLIVDELHHLFLTGLIQRRGRFIEHNDVRLVQE